jgi:sec-independent protein translocase protein TatA
MVARKEIMLNAVAMLGSQDLMIIAVVVLVLFGGKKIPELLRGVGRGVGELQKGLDEGKRQLTSSIHEDSTPPTAAAPVTPQVASPTDHTVAAGTPQSGPTS